MEQQYFEFNTGREIIRLPLAADVRVVYLEITTVCNYSCITCIRHSWRDGLSHMRRETFDRIMDSFNGLPMLRTIHIGGFGEPLSHPDVLDMIAVCKSRGYRVEMITNGSLLTEAVSAALIKTGLDQLYVSLDGPDDESFSQIRPGASFRQVTANIRILQLLKAIHHTTKPGIGIEFVATTRNFSKLPSMRRIVDELNAHPFVVTNLMPYHESMQSEILYDKDADLMGFAWESPLLSVKTALNMKLRTQRTCRFAENNAMAITHRGDVSSCYALMHNYDCFVFGRKKTMVAHSFGNVLERSLRETWMDPVFAYFRWMARNAQYPSCTDCRQVEGCQLALSNESDCWGNRPSCGDCLWARDLIACP